jgi:leucyl aminopeptidase
MRDAGIGRAISPGTAPRAGPRRATFAGGKQEVSVAKLARATPRARARAPGGVSCRAVDPVFRTADLATHPAGLLAVGVHELARTRAGAASASTAVPPRDTPGGRLDAASRGALKTLLASGDFAGRPGESALLYATGVAAARVLVVGLGTADAFDARPARVAAATAARRARDLAAERLALAFPDSIEREPALARAVGEGLVTGHHRHNAYVSDGGKPALAAVELLTAGRPEPAIRDALAAGVARGEAVCLARDLASTPGQDLPPSALAQRAREVAKRVGAKATVLDVAAMERLGMNCVLAVGRGSPHEPCFIELVKEPAGATRAAKSPAVVLIGKGVTFDTGGVSLKPREGMSKMKYDMSGAAAVIGTFAALDTLELPFRLVGLIPSAENAIGGRSFKPGDVLRALDGTTIEITNTDAEGRLLLADALGYAKRFAPAAVVDLATLTGAMSIALGRHAAGLFTADERLATELHRAGEATGERLWRMPLWPEFLSEMRGDTADLVNSNERREGAACTAAAFLSHFAKGMPWAHLDIASTAWTYNDRPDAARGPNAFGVRLLVDWLEARARDGAPATGKTSTRRAAR